MKPAAKKRIRLILALLVILALFWYSRSGQSLQNPTADQSELTLNAESVSAAIDVQQLDEERQYSTKDEVALYIHTYGHLPDNYVTKAQARDKGWDGGSLEQFFPGCSIGGDKFGNREGLLPEKAGRQYYECDIDTAGKDQRGAERIVFSNDGLIYYTDDHYESFTLLYGEE